MVMVNRLIVLFKVCLIAGILLAVTARTAVSQETQATEPATQSTEDQNTAIEEIFVTGSRIRGLSEDRLASPLETVDRDELQNAGAFRVADIVNNLTINTGSENNPDAFTQNFTAGTSNINLRGLGVASTLVLLNGRRQTFSAFATGNGENFVDTSSLVPMIAIEQIKILKDGASSLYGSDAVAGVANFNTRNTFTGFELETAYQAGTADQSDLSLSAIYGAGNDNTHFMAAVSALMRKPLGTDEKRLSTVQDDTSRAGFPGTFLVPTQPDFTNATNLTPTQRAVYAATWSAVYDLNSNGTADFFEQIPNARQPAFADLNCADIANTDDTTLPPTTFPLGACQFDFGSYFSLVPKEDRTQLFSTLVHQFNNGLEFTAELGYAHNETERRNSPAFPITKPQVVPASHPDNPFGTNVLFVGRVLGSAAPASISQHDSDTTRLMAALKGNINANWNWEASFTHSKNNFILQSDDTLKAELTRALTGLGGSGCTGNTPGAAPCAYFNPFGSSLTGTGTANTAAIFDYITGTYKIDAEASLQVIEAFVSGQLMELTHGPISLAAGIQRRGEVLDYDYNDQANAENFLFVVGNPDFKADRTILAEFIELAMPLSASVDLQLAARNEDYDSDFSSTDPKIALLWRVIENLSIRGSYSSSFRAPSLFQQNGIQTTLEEIGLVRQFLPVRSRPNQNPLKPEEANTYNIGFSLRAVEGSLKFDFDFWSFDYDNVIIRQDPNAIVNAGLLQGDADALAQIEFTGNVVSPASLSRINVYYDNASTLQTSGVDCKLAYYWPISTIGQFSAGLDFTKVRKYDLDDPQLGKIDGLNSRNFRNFAISVPDQREVLLLSWEKDSKQSANLVVHHIGSYQDDQNNAPIESQTTYNIQYNYFFDSVAGLENGLKFTVGGINVTDENPPHVATNGGYDSKVHDPRGALYYIRASIPF